MPSRDYFGPGVRPGTRFKATPMNGDQVLGTDTTRLLPFDNQSRPFACASPTSLWTFDDPARVDLAGLLDGTIAGRVRIQADRCSASAR